MTTSNNDPSAFPVNGSYAMQQAWRLYFDKGNVTLPESYIIEKNYPTECTVMYGRSYKAAGINIVMPNHLPQQKSCIDKIFEKMLDHPKLTIAASCVFITGFLV